MATYASLVSLMYTIEKIEDHPRPPISLDVEQVKSLKESITFLQDFLEIYNYHVCDDILKSRIVDIAHAVEDVIESHIADRILAQFDSSELFYQDLQRVIEDMDLMKKEVMEIKEKMGSTLGKRISVPEVGSLRFSPLPTMLGFDDVLLQLLDKLTGQPSSERQIIPIVGMGGMGKTTLARYVYEHSLIVQHFDICVWTIISQEYSAHDILVQLLSGQVGNPGSLSQMNEMELGERLHKTLWGRRYLIIMDDMWSTEAWDKVRLFFPNNNNGSGIIITTRLTHLALYLSGANVLEMNFLNEETSWTLLSKIVFGEGDDCPIELEETGKLIAKNCRGLPLSLVVIGGLLAKSNQTQESWEYIAQNLNTILSLENNAQCLEVLYLSYNHLPVYLKPCFLYFGVFKEDCDILAFELIQLWAAEGFLKPISGKSLEEVGEQYLMELVHRNLVLNCDWKYSGKLDSCKIHDLLRELCIREAEKEKFFCVIMKHGHDINNIQQGLKNQRRIVFHHQITSTDRELFNAFQYASNARSLIFDSIMGNLPSNNLRMVRVLRGYYGDYDYDSFGHMVNMRFFAFKYFVLEMSIPSSIYLFWNLHTLICFCTAISISIDISKMPNLRYMVARNLFLGKSSSDKSHRQGNFTFKYLHTLEGVCNFRYTRKMVKRISNIRTLYMSYDTTRYIRSYYCLNNCVRLQKLEELTISLLGMESISSRRILLHDLTLPHSLKELTLRGASLQSEDISTQIGSLPLLQVLKLQFDSIIGTKWETIEGQFCNLKHLEIFHCQDLECWMAEDTHFPCLGKLVLRELHNFKEIPSSIGDIPTLKLIEIRDCSEPVYVSAKNIVQEQHELGNEDLQVVVEVWEHTEAMLESLASHNFIVRRFKSVWP